MLSIWAGYTRYAPITRIQGDSVNAPLLGMTKVVGEDSARNALKAIAENAGIAWLQKHLYQSYRPLLELPWILDADVTVKTLYGHQEGATVGYNPHKPGRPSHTYHTRLFNFNQLFAIGREMANTRRKVVATLGLLNLRAGRGQMNFQLAKSSFAFGMLFQYQFVCSHALGFA